MPTTNEQIVKETTEATAYILNEIKDAKADTIERITTSDRRTTEIFQAHEQRDQERFAEIQGEMIESRRATFGKLDSIDDRVKETNGRLTQVEIKATLIEDRADQVSKLRAVQTARRHAWFVGFAGAGATALVAGILKAAGVA